MVTEWRHDVEAGGRHFGRRALVQKVDAWP